MKKLIVLPLFFVFLLAFAQNEIKVYPSSWWVGMKNPHVQLMVRGKNISNYIWTLKYPGVRIDSLTKTKNVNYLFINLTIEYNAKPGILKFRTTGMYAGFGFDFKIDQSLPGKGKTWARGIHSDDFIYLIMPDRFSNGDPNNDHYANMRDTVVDRE